jgi:REP element-mobilizing transposase RayT
MKHESNLPQRRSIRLPGCDYSQPGPYFLTICIRGYKCLLGEIVLGQMKQNDAGEMVDRAWNSIPQQFPTVELDEHVVMPNHFHGIIKIVGTPIVGAGKADKRTVGASPVGARDSRTWLRATTRVAPTDRRTATRAAPTMGTPALGEIVGAFKSVTTDDYIRGVREQGWPRFSQRLWQRDFYEHIVRNELELERIRDYIRRNPQMWAIDRYNPDRTVPVIDKEGRVVPWEES